MTHNKDFDFLNRVKRHPELRARFESILDVAEAKGEGPDTADAIEQKVVDEVRQLGAEVITDWAKDKERREMETERTENPNARIYKKKRSAGTQPSAPLK